MKGDGGGTVMHDVCEVVATGLRIRPHNRSWSAQDAR